MTPGMRKLPTGFGRLWTAQTISSLRGGVTLTAPACVAVVTKQRNGQAEGVACPFVS